LLLFVLCREGRAAITTAFGVFKYIACYSLTQFASVLILYWVGANLTDAEFLYIDFFLITTFSITFSRTGPYQELVRERPLVSLLGASPILSILIQMILVIAVQTFMYLNVQKQPWFVSFQDNDEDDYMSYENSAVFFASSYQYIILAITFAKGAPFRSSIFSNYWLLANIVIALGGTIWINMYPTDGLAELLEIKEFPSMTYKALYIGVAFINFLLSFIMEKFLIDNEVLREKLRAHLKECLPMQDQAYAKIESEIEKNPTWPPVSDKKVDLATIFQKQESVVSVENNMEKSNITLEDLLEHSDHEDHGLALLSEKDNDDSELQPSYEAASQPTSSAAVTFSLLSSQKSQSTSSLTTSSSPPSSSTQQDSQKTDEKSQDISSPTETVTTL
ncbi:hypothetical protein EGW08_022188, partial [Elysia chlorotica]